jgi:hypothetical protein
MRSELAKLVDQLGIKASVTYGNNAPDNGDDWRHTAQPWTVKLTFKDGDQRRALTVPFWTGSGWTREPDAADVLSSLVSDASSVENARSFEEWASDLGFDTDSRKAFATFQECERSAKRVRRFLGDHFDAVAQAEH